MFPTRLREQGVTSLISWDQFIEISVKYGLVNDNAYEKESGGTKT